MKKTHLILMVALLLTPFFSSAQSPCEDGFVDGTYNCQNVDMWAFVHLDDIGGGNNTNDCWGWTHRESMREFALIGKNNGTAFIEITDPGNPVYLGDLPTQSTNTLWRDVKVRGDFAYIVSEAGDHGLQSFDLTQLLNVEDAPVEFEPTGTSDDFGNSHNIVINPEADYAYSVGGEPYSGGLHCIDISNPEEMTTAGGFSDDGYTHDAQVVFYHGPDQDYAGKEVAVCANEDNIAIVDVSDKSDMTLIASFSYTDVGYTHQLWLTEDHRYLLFNDELDEMNYDVNTRTYVADLLDLDNPEVLGFYEADVESIDHNLYTEGNLVYASNYRSGLRILDVGDIDDVNLVERGYFDVSPSNDNPQFSGSWSNYCYFPSGTVVATDMYDGFFVLRPRIFTLSEDVLQIDCGVTEYSFDLTMETELSGSNFEIELNGLPAAVTVSATEIVAPGTTTVTLSNLDYVPGGSYWFEVVLVPEEYGEYIVEIGMETENDPGPSALISPVESTVEGSEGSVSFEWSAVDGASSYLIEVSDTETFDNIIYSEETTETSVDIDSGELNLGMNYWRVRSLDDCGTGVPSMYSYFDLLSIGIEGLGTMAYAVYPNPTSGELTIELNTSSRTLFLYDLSGRLVLRKETLGERLITWDLSKLETGTYIMRDENGAQVEVQVGR